MSIFLVCCDSAKLRDMLEQPTTQYNMFCNAVIDEQNALRHNNIVMTSQHTSSWALVQQLVHDNNKENINASNCWFLVMRILRWPPDYLRTINAGSNFNSRRHHDDDNDVNDGNDRSRCPWWWCSTKKFRITMVTKIQTRYNLLPLTLLNVDRITWKRHKWTSL